MSRALSSDKVIANARVNKLLDASGVLPALYNYRDKVLVPAQVLQQALEEQWALQKGDKDMVVMVHEFFYREGKKNRKLQTSLVVVGKDEKSTPPWQKR